MSAVNGDSTSSKVYIKLKFIDFLLYIKYLCKKMSHSNLTTADKNHVKYIVCHILKSMRESLY